MEQIPSLEVLFPEVVDRPKESLENKVRYHIPKLWEALHSLADRIEDIEDEIKERIRT